MSKKYCKDAILSVNLRKTVILRCAQNLHVARLRFFAALRMTVPVLPGTRNHRVQKPTQKIFQFLIIFMVITLIGGGFALLVGGRLTAPTSARNASQLVSNYDLSVVGPPSLPAATVDAIFSGLGSPMAGTGKLVEQTARQANIDDAFAVAVWWKETNDGETGVGLTNHNPGGVRDSIGYPSAYTYTLYPNYSAAIVDWFHILHIRYIDYGLTTVYAISHPYVGTSNSPSWAAKVVALMLQYRGEAPPPSTPTVAPSPTITPQALPHRKIVTDPGITRGSQSQKGTEPSTATHRLSTGAKAASTGSPALSPTIEWLIVALALLLAIVVALWARSLSASLSPLSVRAGAVWSGDGTLASPAPGIAENIVGDAPMTPTRGVTTSGLTTPPPSHSVEGRGPHKPAPMVLRLPARPRAVPNTEALWGFAEPAVAPDTSALQSFAGFPATQGNGRFRRTILLPSQPGAPNGEMAEVDARPSGLLARYGKTQQE